MAGAAGRRGDGLRLRGVALPAEHGGWSLTLEPVLLGLLVEPSGSGFLLGLAALAAFLARSPLKLVMVDRRRRRNLPRTVTAAWFAAAYLAVLALAAVGASVTAAAPFWAPLAAAAPLVLVGFVYDVRSLSRRLVPELVGSIGMGSAAAAIVLAGGGAPDLAAGSWLVIAARAVAAVLHVRVQLRRAKDQQPQRWQNDLAQAVAAAVVGVGALAGVVPLAGLTVTLVVSVVHGVLVRLPPARTAVIGAQQVVIGLGVVLATGLGAVAT